MVVMAALSAAEMRAYRDAHPEYVEQERIRMRAKRAALQRLCILYAVEYNTMLREELSKAHRNAKVQIT
jgi:hypothetical protein